MIARETTLNVNTKLSSFEFKDPYCLDQFLAHDTTKEFTDSNGVPLVGSAIVGESTVGGGAAGGKFIPFHAVNVITKTQETSEAPDPEDDVCKAEGGEELYLYYSAGSVMTGFNNGDTIPIRPYDETNTVIFVFNEPFSETIPQDALVKVVSATSSDTEKCNANVAVQGTVGLMPAGSQVTGTVTFTITVETGDTFTFDGVLS